MKTIAISVFFACLILTGRHALAGVDPLAADSASQLNDSGLKDCREGRYTACTSEFAAEVSIWRSLGDDYRAHLAVSLANLGFAQAATSAYDESIEDYREALSLTSAVFGADSLQAARIMNDYARSLMVVDSDGQAVKLLERARGITHALALNCMEEESRSLRGLALVAVRRGDARHSEELLERVSRSPDAKGADEELEVATIEANLARLYASVGDFTRADSLLARAGAVYSRYISATDPRLILLSAQRGMQYVDQKKYSLAKQYLEAALANLKAIGAENSPGAASVENSLALANLELGEMREADALLDHALSVQQAAFRKPNRSLAATFLNRALSLGKQRRYPEAIEFAAKSIDVYQATIGSGHPETANALLVYSDLLRAGGSRKGEAQLARTRAQTIFRQFASSDGRKR